MTSTQQLLRKLAGDAAPAPLILSAAPVDGVKHIHITNIYYEENNDFFAAAAAWSGLVNGRSRYVYFGDEDGTEESPTFNTCEVHWDGESWIASGSGENTNWQLTGVGDVASPELCSAWAGSNGIISAQAPVVTIINPTAGTAGDIGRLAIFGSQFYKCWNASPPRWINEVHTAEINTLAASLTTASAATASLTAALGNFTNNGSVSVNDSTVSVNDSTVSVNDSTVSVNNSTVLGNDGAVSWEGSAVSVNNSTVSVNNGTVSVNDGTVSVNDSYVVGVNFGDADLIAGASYTAPSSNQSLEVLLNDDNGTIATFTLNLTARLAVMPTGAYIAVTTQSKITALTITHTGATIYGVIPTTLLAGRSLVITKIYNSISRITSN